MTDNHTFTDTSKNQPTNELTSEIVIVGGGFVGLSFALLLAHWGLKSVVLEKTAYPTVSPDDDTARTQYLDSRNTALSRRTVQIYQEIGLWERLKSHACVIDKVKIFEKDCFGQATLHKEQERVESFGQVAENAHLGHCLISAVRENPLIRLLDGASVTDLKQDDDKVSLGVTQNIDGQTTPLTLTASLVVACDGQHSPVRKFLDIGAYSHDYGQVAVVGVVASESPHNNVAIECFSPVGPLALLPLPSVDGVHRRSVVWICKKGDEQQYLTDDDFFLTTINNTFGEKAGKLTQAGRRGAYPLSKVLAHRQAVGRCVLMGNSAHTLHPVAGQGFNLCMRDAYELAEKIKNAKLFNEFDDGKKLQALLVQYEKERLKDQKRVIFFCDLVIWAFTNHNPLLKWARNVGLIFFDKVPFIKPMVAKFAMGLKKVP